ncbi:MAG: hypothetical protein AAF628_09880 [Planctomycetota bacterium]
MRAPSSGLWAFFLVAASLAPPVASQWVSSGPAKPCATTTPNFTALGTLHERPGFISWHPLVLTEGPPHAAAVLLIGAAEAALPVFGGVLGPRPDLQLPLVLDEEGSGGLGFALGFSPKPLFPVGTSFWFQWWMADPAATSGVCASQTIRGTIR